MGGSPGDVSENPVTLEKRKKGWRMSCDVGKATEGLENEPWRRWSDGKLGEWALLWTTLCYVIWILAEQGKWVWNESLRWGSPWPNLQVRQICNYINVTSFNWTLPNLILQTINKRMLYICPIQLAARETPNIGPGTKHYFISTRGIHKISFPLIPELLNHLKSWYTNQCKSTFTTY